MRRKWFAASIAMFFLWCGVAWADTCDRPDLGQVPVLSEGRVRSFGVHARNVVISLFGKSTLKSCAACRPEQLYCLLSTTSLASVESRCGCSFEIEVAHRQTQELLGLPIDQKRQKVDVLLKTQESVLGAYHDLQRQGQASSGFGNDLATLLTRLDRTSKIFQGEDWLVAPADPNSNEGWRPLHQVSRVDLDRVLSNSIAQLNDRNRRAIAVEGFYESFAPLTWSLFLGVVLLASAIAALRSDVLSRGVAIGTVGLIGLEVAGVALRVSISGRAPVTNMYETVLWVGLFVLILSTILSWRLRLRWILIPGLAGNVAAMFMLRFASSMLDGAIQPLVPVLRDNFWLSTHVTSVTTAYASFGLAWIIANVVLLRHIFGKITSSEMEQWNTVARLSMQVGAVFLAAGILLGGVWADYSWGRFWGWDPKETWSLIAFVAYAAVLHGRYVGWFKGIYFTLATAMSFLFVIMAWFGVNYILAVGLHSYGFSSGGAAFIAAITICQVVIATLVIIREKSLVSMLNGR